MCVRVCVCVYVWVYASTPFSLSLYLILSFSISSVYVRQRISVRLTTLANEPTHQEHSTSLHRSSICPCTRSPNCSVYYYSVRVPLYIKIHNTAMPTYPLSSEERIRGRYVCTCRQGYAVRSQSRLSIRFQLIGSCINGGKGSWLVKENFTSRSVEGRRDAIEGWKISLTGLITSRRRRMPLIVPFYARYYVPGRNVWKIDRFRSLSSGKRRSF